MWIPQFGIATVGALTAPSQPAYRELPFADGWRYRNRNPRKRPEMGAGGQGYGGMGTKPVPLCFLTWSWAEPSLR